MATLRYPSAFNGFVPSTTGQVIAFIRKPEKFKLNSYVQYIETKKLVGLYAHLGRDEMARVVTDEEFAFEDGDERPKGLYNQVPFRWVPFRVYRRDYPWTLGHQAIEQADLKLKPIHMSSALQKAMTNRTRRVINLLENPANWGSNTASANTLNGGRGPWDTASDDPTDANYLAIKRSLDASMIAIHLATNAIVTYDDERLLISPNLATAVSATPEYHNYLRESPFAREQKEGLANPNKLWNLPPSIYNFPLVVEDAVIVTERAKASGVEATAARTFIKDDCTAVILTRQGAVDGDFGPSFSTLQCYHHGPLLAVKAFDDARNERVDGHVEEQFKEVLAAPVSGFLISDVMAACST